MSRKRGRSVRLFLADGAPAGLTTAEIMNWTGHILTGPRSALIAFLKREELKRTGIYFLVGHDLENPDTPKVYIGESDSVGKRLTQHSKDKAKDFWERTCVITSKDQNITKAHARYLEARLIALANDVGKANVANGTAPPPIALPEADQSDMEFFIDQILLILPILGFGFLRQPRVAVESAASPNSEDSPIFKIDKLVKKKHRVQARAQEIDGEFVVLKSSTAAAEWTGKVKNHPSYANLHARIVKSGKLVPAQTGVLSFAENVGFTSPSAASAVIRGQQDNGQTSWKVGNETYRDWHARRVSAAAGGNDEG